MKPGHSWRPSPRVMKVSSSLILLLGILAAVAISARSSIADRRGQPFMAFSGIVSDSICGGTHGTEMGGDAQCTRLCVKLGAEYALAAGRRVYFLKGHRDALDKFAGDRVIVIGRIVARNTISVESIAPLFSDEAESVSAFPGK